MRDIVINNDFTTKIILIFNAVNFAILLIMRRNIL